jgi:hypothetical protein
MRSSVDSEPSSRRAERLTGYSSLVAATCFFSDSSTDRPEISTSSAFRSRARTARSSSCLSLFAERQPKLVWRSICRSGGSTLTRHRLWTPSFRRDGENGSRYADMALSNCTSRHGSIRSVSSFGLLSMLDRRANTSLISLGCHRQTPNSLSPPSGRRIVTSLTRSRP